MCELDLPIPSALKPERLGNMLKNAGQLSKLESLADRGIILNTWQANEYLLGTRAVGKTYLGLVKIAERYKNISVEIDLNFNFEEYDPDVTTRSRKVDFILQLIGFVEKHYKDIYTVNRLSSCHIILESNGKIPNERWWQ